MIPHSNIATHTSTLSKWGQACRRIKDAADFVAVHGEKIGHDIRRAVLGGDAFERRPLRTELRHHHHHLLAVIPAIGVPVEEDKLAALNAAITAFEQGLGTRPDGGFLRRLEALDDDAIQDAVEGAVRGLAEQGAPVPSALLENVTHASGEERFVTLHVAARQLLFSLDDPAANFLCKAAIGQAFIDRGWVDEASRHDPAFDDMRKGVTFGLEEAVAWHGIR